jgi:alkylglycerol monooxygenase
MDLNPVGLAVPIFFSLMALEIFIAWFQKKEVYRVNDTVANLGCGIGDQLIGLFAKVFTVGIYTWVFQNFALLNLDAQNPWVWAVGFILIDFFYYWYHRESHLVALFWSTHSVHHQSEDYNLAVALRQSWFAKFFAWIFYIPVAIFGISPSVFLICYSLNLFYQFWIHTTLIDRLGIIELVFNTPSHHRVHHCTNERYLDKNYAGVLIIWDRMFGSFQRELESDPPVYGVLAPIQTWNPIVANISPLQKICTRAWNTQNPSLFFKTLFNPPGWVAPNEHPKEAKPFGYDLDNPKAHPYSILQFAIVTITMSLVLTFSNYIDSWFLPLIVICILLIPITISGYVEQKKWAVPLEGVRCIAFLLLLIFNPHQEFFVLGIILAIAGLLGFLLFGRSSLPNDPRRESSDHIMTT